MSSSVLQRSASLSTSPIRRSRQLRARSQSSSRRAMSAQAPGGSDDGQRSAPATAPTTAAPLAKAPKPSLAQRLGQSFNSAGIALFARVALSDQPLAMPHLTVPDVRWVDWPALRAAGFKGVVFDKDNTLTVPYSLELHPRAAPGLAAAAAAFDGAVVLYSNSAGLAQFDPQGEEAGRLEEALGLAVLRHTEKKPAGGPVDMERHFGCKAQELIMVGDRFLTDVVFGNRNGMLTVRPAPFTTAGEPTAVLLARAVEERCAARWAAAGVAPPPHPLVPEVDRLKDFVRQPDNSTSDTHEGQQLEQQVAKKD